MSNACNEIIDDIEDLILSQDITPKERYSSRKSITLRPKKIKSDENAVLRQKNVLESVIPGVLIIYDGIFHVLNYL